MVIIKLSIRPNLKKYGNDIPEIIGVHYTYLPWGMICKQ